MAPLRDHILPLETTTAAPVLEGPAPRARLRDLIGLGRLFLLGFAFWTVTGLVVAAAEAAGHAWESRQRAIAAATFARQLAEARLHVLSAQLQPHFLFNALHAISALVWEDPARADRLLARLSEMLRLTLRSGTRV